MSRTHVLAFLLAPLLSLAACESEPGTPADETTGDGDGDSSGDGDGAAGDGDGAPGDGDGAAGDGDGAAGDGDGDATGSGDPTCDAFANTPVLLTAAASAAEAATASIVPDGATLYQVTLPEGAAGFVELQIPDWDTVQGFFTTAEIEYTVTVEDNSQVEMSRMPIESCPAYTTQNFGFPHWTPATIEFAATGPREVPLMVVQQ